ncbi:MAG: hypothetical protein K6G64_00470 [Eubacterium sp.]|nr:hypothetical protein [Eubacterium sp.]
MARSNHNAGLHLMYISKYGKPFNIYTYKKKKKQKDIIENTDVEERKILNFKKIKIDFFDAKDRETIDIIGRYYGIKKIKELIKSYNSEIGQEKEKLKKMEIMRYKYSSNERRNQRKRIEAINNKRGKAYEEIKRREREMFNLIDDANLYSGLFGKSYQSVLSKWFASLGINLTKSAYDYFVKKTIYDEFTYTSKVKFIKCFSDALSELAFQKGIANNKKYEWTP